MKRKHFGLNLNQRLFVLVFLVPSMGLYFLFSLYPMVRGVVISFFNYSPLNPNPPFVGLANYSNALTDDLFIQSFLNTLKFVILGVAGNLIVATLVAVGIASVYQRWTQEAFKTVYFLPTVAQTTAMIIIFKYMLDPQSGVHNWFLALSGQVKTIYWLADPTLATLSVLMLLVWQDFGISMIIILAGIQGIPRYIYESARIDGAGPMQQFFSITLPLIVRSLAFVTITTMISYFQLFAQVQLLTDGGPQMATQTVGLTVYENAFRTYRMGYASALSILLMLVIMVVSLIQLKAFKTDLEY